MENFPQQARQEVPWSCSLKSAAGSDSCFLSFSANVFLGKIISGSPEGTRRILRNKASVQMQRFSWSHFVFATRFHQISAFILTEKWPERQRRAAYLMKTLLLRMPDKHKLRHVLFLERERGLSGAGRTAGWHAWKCVINPTPRVKSLPASAFGPKPDKRHPL